MHCTIEMPQLQLRAALLSATRVELFKDVALAAYRLPRADLLKANK
jgi:hypothetical protein